MTRAALRSCGATFEVMTAAISRIMCVPGARAGAVPWESEGLMLRAHYIQEKAPTVIAKLVGYYSSMANIL